MKILVTGGAGFIGSNLCRRLIDDGHEVWCLDNLSTGDVENLGSTFNHPRFHFLEADVCDDFGDIKVDRVYNLACPASPPQYQRDPVGTMKASVLGVLNALEYCHRTQARLFQASTSEVYGDPEVHPQPENYVGAVNCTGPRACYDEGKRAAETLCFDYSRQYGTEVRVARLFNTYGPRMHPEDGRVIPNFIVQCLQKLPLTVYGAGTQTRSFCYIDDIIDALILLMEAPGQAIGPINLGSEDEYTIRDLAQRILERTGSESTVDYLPLPQDDPRVRRPDASRALEALGWQATTSLDEGLDKTIAWYRSYREGALSRGTDESDRSKVVAIIGGGPAGLTAAYSLQTLDESYKPIVLEATDQVGGIARTETYKGYRFDIGGHRFFTKVSTVERLWREALGDDFVKRPRMSRIYYKNKYYAYPLKIFNALSNMGLYESIRIMGSYIKWKLKPNPVEENFEQWVTNRFGGRLFWHFFKTYTEKVWGIKCTEIQADWATQRIKNLSLRKAVWNALTGANDTSSLIESFDYPRLGPGMMWEAFRDKVVARNGEVRMNARVSRIHHADDKVVALDVIEGSGVETNRYRLEADQFISSMPLSELILAMRPPAPAAIQDAARTLRYRDFLIVVLILDAPDPFPDNWIYIHSPEVKVGRIQNFRSWSEELIPNAHTCSIGMEFFCQQGDELWSSPNEELIALATRELEFLGLAKSANVIDGHVIRQEKAYPVYDGDYREALDMIRGWLAGFSNLQVVGRNGMHRYNNQDHSMMTALLAVQNILGGKHDLWSVNVEREYHEDIESSAKLSAET